MGRPSILEATVERHAGSEPSIRIGGASVMVAEGRFTLDREGA
jgi:predicted PhzF superfamily epimerase YddE/YHI9